MKRGWIFLRRSISRRKTLTLLYVLVVTVMLLQLKPLIPSTVVVPTYAQSRLTVSGSGARCQQIITAGPLSDLDDVKDAGETNVRRVVHPEDNCTLWFNPPSCSVVDFLAGPDPTSHAFYERSLICGQQARNRDVMCSIFLSQVGLNDDGDCVRQTDDNQVPRIVYFVIFGDYPFQFLNYVSIMAAKRHVSPSALYVIGDAHPVGYWWKRVLRDCRGIRFVYRQRPDYIGGKKVTILHHVSDLVRLQTLLLNGGIYLDADMVVTRPLDSILGYNITMGIIEDDTGMGNAFIAAKRNSDFVREWYNNYNTYKNTNYWKNSLRVPRKMWLKNPTRVHLESYRLYSPNWFEADKLFKHWDFDWSQNYAVHIWSNSGNPIPRSEGEIQTANTTIAQVFRNALYGDPKPRQPLSADSKQQGSF